VCIRIVLALAVVVSLEQTVFSYDYSRNFQDLAHLDIPSGYCASWYDADSSNYFDLVCWGDSGLAIVKATDPADPTYIKTVPHYAAHDVKVIGNYAYVGRFGWYSFVHSLMIVPLQSEYPYYDSSGVRKIPFSDAAYTPVGTTCDTIPLGAMHTMFATDLYLLITEGFSADPLGEIAILDISSNPVQLV
jgi:hypothetical protein